MRWSSHRKRLSAEISRVIELASEESIIIEKLPIESHLLVGILAESDNQAAYLLRERGLTIRFVRAYFIRESLNYVELPSSSFALNFARGAINFLPYFLYARTFQTDLTTSFEIQAVLERAEWLLKENEALSAGIVLLSMMRNPRYGVAKFFRESGIDVDELDSCLTKLEPLELRKLSLGEKLFFWVTFGRND